MNFILEQQAQFAADMQGVRASIRELRDSQARTHQFVAMLAETQSESIQIVTQSIQALVDAQARTDEQMKRTDERLGRTDERLNVLINIVERHSSDGHDG